MYCTTGRRADGFGAHFQNILVDILYTYNTTTDHRYVFPNIASFEHNYANEPDFADRLVRYMNLREHFSMKSDSADTSANIHHYSVSNYTYVENNLTQLLASPTMDLIKSLFYADKKTPYDTAYYNVAVHVRRHNKEDNRIDGTNTPDEYYLNVMKYIRANHGNTEKPLRFHIYSQCADSEGAEAAFKEKFMNTDTEFHLNGDVIPTFHGMVFGDALVTSASSYSYCAAFLCNGVVYYKWFWHKPSNNWIVGDYLSS
jgi:hypothetical protein